MDSIGLVLGLAFYLSASISLYASLSGVSMSLPYALTSELECAFSPFYNLAHRCSSTFRCNSVPNSGLVPECNSVPECNLTFTFCDSAVIETCCWFANWFLASYLLGIPS